MGCCDKKLPSNRTMAVNAIQAAGRAMRAIVQRQRVLARGRTVLQRLALCQACDQAVPDAEKPQFLRCTQCGCWLNGNHLTNAKIKLATETCPLGKWAAES